MLWSSPAGKYHQLNKMLMNQPLLIPTYSAGDCDKSFNRKKDTLFFLTQQLHRLIGENLQHLSTYYLWVTDPYKTCKLHSCTCQQAIPKGVPQNLKYPPLVPIDVIEMELKWCLCKRNCWRDFRSCTWCEFLMLCKTQEGPIRSYELSSPYRLFWCFWPLA